MNLIYKNEKLLYRLILIVSLLFWGVVILGTFGGILIYLLFLFLIYLFVQSAFIAYIKGTGAKVSEQQFPELYEQYKKCCEKLDINIEPEFYIINSDGILNALATRFLRQHYVVLYSNVIDAFKKHPDSINFYIGHELGHIKRKHLHWMTLIWPGTLLPLYGAAYFRAREYTCDLHGLYCCKQPKDAAFGIAVLATGAGHWSKLNIKDYLRQSDETGGFWMSFHEFTGDYPWLCKRMKHIVDASQGKKSNFPRRSFFAGFFALFIPRFGVGGASGLVSLMIVIAIIGILSAVAIPAYQDYKIRAKVLGSEMIRDQLIKNATPYIMEYGELPYNLQIINLPQDLSNDVIKSVEVTDQGFVLYTTGAPQVEDQTIIYQPYMDANNNLQWRCDLGTLAQRYLPIACRGNSSK